LCRRCCGPIFLRAERPLLFAPRQPFVLMTMKNEALTSVPMKDVEDSGNQFMKDYPDVNPKSLLWGERLFNRRARDAHTLNIMRSHQTAIRDLWARPCVRCGDITCSWCEACSHPSPWALCSRCDDSGASEGKLWSMVKHRDLRLPGRDWQLCGL